jgi:RHH-type proline utilization regulon transcriptional repressor/proline dehydrogenase/delta 1-pyrroline-5-carboxylate dehydrogenase
MKKSESEKSSHVASSDDAEDAAVSKEVLALAIEARKAQLKWDRQDDRLSLLRDIVSGLGKNAALEMTTALETVAGYDPRPRDLIGPTGESNRLSLHGRGVMICAGKSALSLAIQALLTGNTVLLVDAPSEAAEVITAFEKSKLPKGLITSLSVPLSPSLVSNLPSLGGVALTVGEYDLVRYRKAVAAREGAIIPLITSSQNWEYMVAERALSIDTTASGGNAKLLAANEA